MSVSVTDIAICREFKARLDKQVPLLRLQLFGSRARGEAETDSDFDFLVEVETGASNVRRAIRRIAWEVAFEHNTVFHTVILSKEQLTQRPERSSLLVQAVKHEGVVI